MKVFVCIPLLILLSSFVWASDTLLSIQEDNYGIYQSSELSQNPSTSIIESQNRCCSSTNTDAMIFTGRLVLVGSFLIGLSYELCDQANDPGMLILAMLLGFASGIIEILLGIFRVLVHYDKKEIDQLQLKKIGYILPSADIIISIVKNVYLAHYLRYPEIDEICKDGLSSTIRIGLILISSLQLILLAPSVFSAFQTSY